MAEVHSRRPRNRRRSPHPGARRSGQSRSRRRRYVLQTRRPGARWSTRGGAESFEFPGGVPDTSQSVTSALSGPFGHRRTSLGVRLSARQATRACWPYFSPGLSASGRTMTSWIPMALSCGGVLRPPGVRSPLPRRRRDALMPRGFGVLSRLRTSTRAVLARSALGGGSTLGARSSGRVYCQLPRGWGTLGRKSSSGRSAPPRREGCPARLDIGSTQPRGGAGPRPEGYCRRRVW